MKLYPSKVHVGVSNKDESGESACSFDLTLDGDRIVETSVAAFRAG